MREIAVLLKIDLGYFHSGHKRSKVIRLMGCDQRTKQNAHMRSNSVANYCAAILYSMIKSMIKSIAKPCFVSNIVCSLFIEIVVFCLISAHTLYPQSRFNPTAIKLKSRVTCGLVLGPSRLAQHIWQDAVAKAVQ